MGASARPGEGRTRSRRLLWWTIAAVVVLALASTATVVVALRLDSDDELPPGIPPQPPAVAFDPQIDPVAATAPAPTPAGVQRAIAAAVRNPALGVLTGKISDPLTGEVCGRAIPTGRASRHPTTRCSRPRRSCRRCRTTRG